MRKSFFSLDALGGTVFEAYTNEENWNGWACPYFSFEGAQRLAEAWRNSGWRAVYEEEGDAFAFWLQPEGEPDEPELYASVEIGRHRLYPIGAFSWTWEENSSEILPVEFGTAA